MDTPVDYAALTDLELMDRVRAGDAAAYSTLWLRYRQVGLYAARSFSSSFDPEDVVAEAHARILNALQNGKGPATNFRPYLVTTIQNILRRWGPAQNDVTVTNYDELLETDAEAIGDFSETSLDKLTLQRAFNTLPERWQQVLWHMEVDGVSTKELAASLGMQTTAVVVLAYRAREGLKQAWIDAHLRQDASDPECQFTIRKLGAYERNALTKKAKARVEAHLAHCESCPTVQREAHEVSQVLRSALLPTLLGGWDRGRGGTFGTVGCSRNRGTHTGRGQRTHTHSHIGFPQGRTRSCGLSGGNCGGRDRRRRAAYALIFSWRACCNGCAAGAAGGSRTNHY